MNKLIEVVAIALTLGTSLCAHGQTSSASNSWPLGSAFALFLFFEWISIATRCSSIRRVW